MRPSRLDARVLPRVSSWLLRAVDASRSSSGPGPVRALRRLDDRYASRGPAPQLCLLLIAAVLLTGAAVASTDKGAGEQVGTQIMLGTPVGADVKAHLAEAGQDTVGLARADPGQRHLALLSLTEELTIDQTARLTLESTLVVRRAYVRAPVAGAPEVLEAETGDDVVRTLTALFGQTARRKADEQREYLALAAEVPERGEAGVAFRAQYTAAARTSGLEAAAYRTTCACVMALVVEGAAGQLAELLALPVVRGVEVAPRGAELPDLDLVPLPPAVSGTVPALAPRPTR